MRASGENRISAHLIGEHDFYQGRGCPYRLEPAKVARLFRLGKQAGQSDTTSAADRKP